MRDQSPNTVGLFQLQGTRLRDEVGHVMIVDAVGQTRQQALKKRESLHDEMVVQPLPIRTSSRAARAARSGGELTTTA